jgi:hypothetical protein
MIKNYKQCAKKLEIMHMRKTITSNIHVGQESCKHRTFGQVNCKHHTKSYKQHAQKTTNNTQRSTNNRETRGVKKITMQE